MEFYWNIFLLIMIQIYENVFAIVMKCPAYQLNFQKIVGYRPPNTFLTDNNLMYNQIINNNYKNNISNNSMSVNINCWEICAKDPECISYVLFIDTNICYGFSLFQKSKNYTYIPLNIDLISDMNAIYLEKTCLQVPDRCKNKLWAITRIPGSTLVFQGKKTLPTLVTRRECMEKCLFETEFLCLSASFSPSYKNNYSRLKELNKFDGVVGRCILSNKDKISQPDAFQAATDDKEYLENQCYNRPVEELQCSFELYSKSAFIYSELSYDGLDQKQCQEQCLGENRFYCQGVTFIGNKNNSKCYLHSEDLISMGPRILKSQPKAIYMRRVRCLNISVVCNNNEMVIKYSPNDWFRGKLYANSHSEECSAQGNGTKPTILRLPIGTEIKESRCGILRAYEVKGPIQRVFISTLLIVQYNTNVQTQADRLIKVGCILNNISKENEILNDIPVETTLAFTLAEYPNQGSLHINNREIPKVYLQIVDVDQSFIITNDVFIGQNLELQIILDPPNTPYDIQAKSLTARSKESGAIVLIDENGCPTDTTIFPQLEKVITKNKKMLKGKFHAFKFIGSSSVSFDVKVIFCYYKCPELNCSSTNTNNTSMLINSDNQRTKRSDEIQTSSSKSLHFAGPPNYITVQNDFSTNNSNINRNNSTIDKLEVPLKLNLHVRGPYYGETDTLMCGENNKILVAGFDFRNPNEWCINYSLLIAIIIFLLIIQIIFITCCCYFIKKYKKMIAIEDDRSTLHRNDSYLDYMDARKVHWADQGTMSEFSASQY